MPRPHADFTVYPHKSKTSGKIVYYYHARDPVTGEQLPGKSTGLRTKADAYAYCQHLKETGQLIQQKKEYNPTLQEWCDVMSAQDSMTKALSE